MQSIALNMDWAKLGVFEQNGNYYRSVTHATYDSLDKTLNERNYLFNFSRKSKAPAKVFVWTICVQSMKYPFCTIRYHMLILPNDAHGIEA